MDPAAVNIVRVFSERLAGVLGVLCVPIRLEILVHLLDQPSDVSGLADRLELGITLVSHHLCVMRRAGLVECLVVKRQHRYAASPIIRLHRHGATASDPAAPGAALGPSPGAPVWLVVRMSGDAETRVLLPPALARSLESTSRLGDDGVPAVSEKKARPSTISPGRTADGPAVTIRRRLPLEEPADQGGESAGHAQPAEALARRRHAE